MLRALGLAGGWGISFNGALHLEVFSGVSCTRAVSILAFIKIYMESQRFRQFGVWQFFSGIAGYSVSRNCFKGWCCPPTGYAFGPNATLVYSLRLESCREHDIPARRPLAVSFYWRDQGQ